MMRKYLITLIGVLVLSLSAQAELKFGAKAGLNLTNLIGSGAPHGVQFNYHAGVLAEYKFMNRIGIAPEILFSAQGGNQHIADYNVGEIIKNAVDVKWQTNYVNVPVMLKLYLNDQLSIDLGPQFGFNVSSKMKLDTDNVESSEDNKSMTKAFDFAVGAGLTYDITSNIFVQARYTMSVTSTFEEMKSTMKMPVDARNGVGQISVGFKF